MTGGCGFIGSNFVHYVLNNTEAEVVNLDSLAWPHTIYNHEKFKDNSRYHLCVGDVADLSVVTRAMKGCDAVVHMAAQSHVDKSIADPHRTVRSNVVGTVNLLFAAQRLRVPRFVYTSTDEVYGNVVEGSVTEDGLLVPRNPYSATKAAGDCFVSAWSATYGYRVMTTRASNNYGPYQSPDKVIPIFITNLLQEKPITIHGTGENVRNWLHVTDNCRAVFCVLTEGTPGETYNVESDTSLSNLQLSEVIARLMKELYSIDGKIVHVVDRPGNDLRYSLDSTKIREALGWQPLVEFEQGLRATIQWYHTNEQWWRKVLAEL